MVERINTDNFDRVMVFDRVDKDGNKAVYGAVPLRIIAAIDSEHYLACHDPMETLRIHMERAVQEWVEIQRNIGKLK